MREKGHSGESGLTPVKALTPMDVLMDIRDLLRAERAIDMPADGEDVRDIAMVAGAGEIYVDLDVQFGYVYIPNAPRTMTIYSGTRGALIGTFQQGAFIRFRMPRTTGLTIIYSAGSAAQTFSIYSSARNIEVTPGEFIANVGTGSTGLGKAEDAPHVSGDVGIEVLGVRQDSLVVMTNTAGDYSPFVVTQHGHQVVAALSTSGATDGTGSAKSFIDIAGALGISGVAPWAYNGATWDRLRTPNVFKTFNLAASSAEQTLWTPAGGKKFRLMGFTISIATLAANLILRDNTAGATIFQTGGVVGSVITPAGMGNGILSAAANNLLTIQAGAVSALTGTVWGTEE